jgi:hypothetical protein
MRTYDKLIETILICQEVMLRARTSWPMLSRQLV